MATKKSGGSKYGKAAGKSVKSAMHRKKKGTLKSGKGGKGGKVKSRKQAIAIGLSEARKKGVLLRALRLPPLGLSDEAIAAHSAINQHWPDNHCSG